MSDNYNLNNILDDVRKQSASTNPYKLEVKETSDHKNIMLYTDINKRVGPLHPANAETTILRWHKAGFRLYLKPRTAEELEAFKNSDEGKEAERKHKALRIQRHKLSRKGQNDQLVKDLAEIVATGVKETKAKK